MVCLSYLNVIFPLDPNYRAMVKFDHVGLTSCQTNLLQTIT